MKIKNTRDNVKKWNPAILTPTAGQHTNTITRVTNEFLAEIHNTDVKIRDYIKMARKDPVARSCIEIKALRASLMLGRYRHHNPVIEKWVRDNFDNIEGCLSHKMGRLASAMPLGFSCAEIVFKKDRRINGQWKLHTLNVVDQTRTTFEGKAGTIKNVVYLNGDGRKIAIPYGKMLHIVNGYSSNIGEYDSVYGDPESATAYQYFKAKQAILTEMMISAKQNASGLWVGKADSNETVQVVNGSGEPLFNSDGTPKTEPAMLSLLKQMLNIENNSVIVTDIKNQIQPLQVDSKEGFWQIALTILDSAIMKAYSVPKLVFEEGSGSFGVNGIGKQHQLIMDAQITSIVKQMRDQLIEKVVRPLLVWNFGITDDFGTFSLDPVEDPDAKNLLVNNIITATSSKLLMSTDLTVQNKIRELLELPTLTEQEQFVQSQKQLLQQYFETQTFGGTPPPLFAQQTLEDKEQIEAEKQEAGLPSDLDQGMAQEEAQEAPQPEEEEEQEAIDPKAIEDERKRKNPQNFKPKS